MKVGLIPCIGDNIANCDICCVLSKKIALQLQYKVAYSLKQLTQ